MIPESRLIVRIPVEVGEDGYISIEMTNVDMTSLNIIKDEYGKDFLSGTVALVSDYYDLILQQRVERGINQLIVSYAGYLGVMNTNGLFHYDRSVCELEVGDPETFESIVNLEFKPTNIELDFEYNSYNVKIYATDGYEPVNYNICTDLPLEWNPLNTYDRAQEIEPDVWLGDQGNTVRDTSVAGQTYFSIRDNNIGHDPLDEADPVNSPVWWYLPSGLNPKTYGQERSKYQFSEDAIYDKYNKYWALAGCGGGFYTANISGINIKNELQKQLQDFDFDLDDDWLSYPKSINSKYENNLWLVSTELKTECTAFELIEYIQQLFNCDYVVKDSLLKFIWKGERYNNWNDSLPGEHDLTGVDIYDWANSEDRNIKRHVINFTESDLGTHDNSIIEYENNFIEETSIQGNFDVDLVYSYNKGDTPCMVTTNDDDEVDEDNELLVPSLMHETFYFVDREFKRGIFNGIYVTLQLGFFEQADRELTGDYDFDNWDMEYQILINELALPDQVAICEEVSYSIDKNNYTLKLKTRN